MAYIGNSPSNIQRGRRAVYEFTATAGQTVFTGVDNNGLSLDLLEFNENDVYLNGSRLVLTDDYTVSGDTLTLTSGAALNDILVIVTQDEVANAGSYTKAESDSRYINYDGDIVNGDLQIVGDINLGDNNKIQFGADNDLQIYHSGFNSFIDDSGVGQLKIRSNGTGITLGTNDDQEIFAQFVKDGASTIYYNGSPKLSTTSTGIDVTGTVTADGLTVESGGADINLSGGRTIVTTDSPSGNGLVINGIGTPANYYFDIRDDNVRGIFTVDNNGRVGIGTISPDYKLHVTGDTNYQTIKLGYTETANTTQRVGIATRNYENDGLVSLIALYDDGSNAILNVGGGTTAPDNIEFRTGGSSSIRMNIDNNGDIYCVNNVGIGTASPTEKLEVNGNVKASDYILEAIDATLPSTATDIFVYDTTLDTDGGAWRKRCQHTSWYNETLNTATRGSRREFPAVAVIVLESSNQITIYDGDDPSLPMWMVFLNKGSSGGSNQTTVWDYYAAGPYESKCIKAMNGVIVNAQYRGAGHISGIVKGLTRFMMIEDTSYMRTDEGEFKRNGNLGDQRNTVTNYTKISSQAIYNTQCTDVAITVHPGATVNSATGLPQPTIAVCGELSGMTVIDSDGASTYSLASSTYHPIETIDFNEDGDLVVMTGYHGSGQSLVFLESLNWSNIEDTYLYNSAPFISEYSNISVPTKGNIIALDRWGGNAGNGNVHQPGLAYLYHKSNDHGQSMVCGISTTFNTGWMIGDTIIASLSDTDSSDLTSADTCDDRSPYSNGLDVYGTITRTPVAANANLVGYSGFSGTNQIIKTHDSDLDLGTGDFTIMMWAKHPHDGSGIAYYLFDKSDSDGSNRIGGYYIPADNRMDFYTSNGSFVLNNIPRLENWSHVAYVRRSGTGYIYVNGELMGSGSAGENLTSSDGTSVLRIGARYNGVEPWTLGQLSLFRISKDGASSNRIKRIYEDEKELFAPNAKCVLYGSYTDLTAIAYDKKLDVVHVGTGAGRSEFKGLRRIGYTTDPVDTAISASNGLVVEE